MPKDPNHPVCSYEGSAYRTEFWGEGRDYEDAAERVALEQMLPPTGKRLIDIGGGYGRLVPLFDGYEQVIVFDYALSQLRQAQGLWGSTGQQGHPRYFYVSGDFYQLPFAPNAFDTVVMVRTLHHAVDAPAVLHGVADILTPSGSLLLEFANKRNLKAVLRYFVGRQRWSPFDREPVEFVSLNFDFHPAWIESLLSQENLRIRQRRAVSTFRLNLFKRLLPTDFLVTLDRLFQPLGALLPLSPSVFIRCEAPRNISQHSVSPLFRCTACGSIQLDETVERLTCTKCGTSFPVQDGIYNFKVPCSESTQPSIPVSQGNIGPSEEDPYEP